MGEKVTEYTYWCCDSSHVGLTETETCFFCGSLVAGVEIVEAIPAITPADLNPNDVSLYPGTMNHLAYEWDDVPA